MPLNEKQLTGLAPLTIATRGVKRYHIDQPDQPLTKDVTESAYAHLVRLLPPAEDADSASWVVLHRGGDSGAYMNVYSWVWDNVVEARCICAGQPLIGCPDKDPTNFIDLTRPWIGCVWELAPFEHERAAWARHVLSPEQPDLASYMTDTMPDGLVGT